MAIYQARFLKYLHGRGIADTKPRKVWAFLGDGECDEPKSLGAISLAGREHLDNLIFVINCNLQRLDGPVRGNGKIVQELEGLFHGAGWNVIKVLWGSGWDRLFAKDQSGQLRKRMEECVDGEYQDFKSKNGAYVRQQFFNKYPETAALVKDMSDDEIWSLRRGGHDPEKVYAAYAAAVKHTSQPTVILAKTVKGYGMGEAGEGQNITISRRRWVSRRYANSAIGSQIPFRMPRSKTSPSSRSAKRNGTTWRRVAVRSAARCRNAGPSPCRSTYRSSRPSAHKSPAPRIARFRRRWPSCAFSTRCCATRRSANMWCRSFPTDKSRTFGMEGMFRQFGIFSQVGQLYKPQDADQLMYYREDRSGQMLQEGINEAGAMSSWIAAATSYSTSNVPMIPFYIYYSMFGLQRVGDLAWAAGDMRARGFLLGGTAGAHDPQRRRVAARGWAQPSPRRDHSELRALTIRPSPTRSRSSSRTAYAE